MLRNAMLLMASRNEPVKTKPINVDHYIDPHYWWNGGEIITYGECQCGTRDTKEPKAEERQTKPLHS